MKNSIGIILVCSDKYIIESLLLVKHVLEKQQAIDFRFYAICLDDLYSGNSESILLKNNINYLKIPKFFPQKNWWIDQSASFNNFKVHKPQIIYSISKYLSDKNIHICLLVDDTGPLESNIIHMCNDRNIKVFLQEHGFAYTNSIPDVSWSKDLIYGFIAKLNWPDYVLPFGRNGKSNILAISEATREKYLSHGYDPKKVVVTGYPYFEKILSLPKVIQKNHKIKRILIVSTGWSKFGDSNHPFYNYITNMTSILSATKKYYITYRPKPGENTDDLMLAKDVTLSTVQNPQRDIENSDLIIGDQSMMLLEGYIRGVPFIRINYDNETFVGDIIQPEIITSESNIVEKVKYALSKEYQKKIFFNKEEKLKQIFGSHMRESSELISKIIINNYGNS